MKLIKYIFVAFMVAALFCSIGTPLVRAQEGSKIFTLEELKQYDGKDGHKTYFAFEGKVYDVTGSVLWKLGEHYGLQAGNDLTGKLSGAPHGTEVFVGRFPVVGTLAGAQPSIPSTVVTPSPQQEEPRVWYENRIRILGLSILGWTGIILGILFVLNFGSCFALPWHNNPLPKALEAIKTHEGHPKFTNFGSFHKYMAWATLIVGIVHGVLGIMQIFGYYL